MSEGEITREDLQDAFNEMDTDNSGFVEAKEIKAIAAKVGCKLSDDDLDQIIKKADESGDGKISFEEFAKSILQ